MTIQVLYCHTHYDEPHTGGEWAHHHTLNYLSKQSDIDLRELEEDGVSALKITEFSRSIQLWFFKMFWRLPRETIIVQASESYIQLCLANWALKFRRRRPRILMLVHSDPYWGGMNWKGVLVVGFCFRIHVRSADRLIANSLDTCRRLIQLGVDQEKIFVIKPPAQEFLPPRQTGKSSGVMQIICPANIYPKKGQEVLIKAMRNIKDDRVNVILPGLVKDHVYYERLRTLIKRYDLDNRIKFVGYLHGQEMSDACAKSSLCIIPSLHEPYGMVVQEAMLFGLPVIASRVGGLTEQINDGVDGFLVPPDNPDALANAISRVVNNSDLREQIIQNALEKATTFPTWESVMERTCNVVREMAKEK
jgi:glycosyltransferase involved in cell wall biosynthesis